MSPGLALALVVVLIGANALFVAAEFALVGASRGILQDMAETGHRSARRVTDQLSNLSFVLSACQFGITATSLLVGFLAEDAIGDAVVRPVLSLFDLPEASVTAVSIGAALFLSTIVQMVVGELAPKNLAIARPDTTALGTSWPMQVFSTLFGPVIRVFDASAAWLTSHLFRVEVANELGGGLSMDELSRIIEASGEEGMLSAGQATILTRAVSLQDRRVADVMIPRVDVTWVDAGQPVSDLRQAARESGHSRFPVRRGPHVVGTVHVKDLMAVPARMHERTTMADIAAPTLLVSESEPARGLLGRFRGESRTFGVVVDEYGDVTGVVTMEDVLEQLVGHIEDEHDDDEEPVAQQLSDGRVVLPGRLPVEEVADELGVDPSEGDFDTVAGFVIHLLGGIPGVGDAGEHAGRTWTVHAMSGARIDEVVVSAATEDPGDDDGQVDR